MDFLETLFWDLSEEKEPDTPEYRENSAVRDRLLKEFKEAMGWEMVDKVTSIYVEHEEMECRRYFLHGVRLGLELLRL